MSTLCPSTTLLRRPSSAADFILSRGAADSRGQLLPSPSRSLSPSDSSHSAPLGGGRCGGGWPSPGPRVLRDDADGSLASLGGPGPAGGGDHSGGSFSTESTPCSSRAVSPVPSPEVRRRYWVQKLVRMKDDIDRIGAGFRQAGASIRDSIENLVVKMSPVAGRRRVETVPGAAGHCGIKVGL